jgi:hypothetical protein
MRHGANLSSTYAAIQGETKPDTKIPAYSWINRRIDNAHVHYDSSPATPSDSMHKITTGLYTRMGHDRCSAEVARTLIVMVMLGCAK